jgi:hypothetical protein
MCIPMWHSHFVRQGLARVAAHSLIGETGCLSYEQWVCSEQADEVNVILLNWLATLNLSSASSSPSSSPTIRSSL